MTVQTDDKYWDCECEHNYINKKSEKEHCGCCDTNMHEQPDSIKSEVKKREAMERTISQMKNIVVNLRCTQTDLGIDYGREVEDWMYGVEVDYQNHHRLDQDDWNVIESEVK